MVRDHTRRDLIRIGTGASLPWLAGCGESASNAPTGGHGGTDATTATTGPELAGRVVDVGGESVAGARVTVFDASGDADAVLASTATAADGSFRVTVDPVDEVTVLARGDGGWFATAPSVAPDRLDDPVEIRLQRHLLFGPEPARDEDDTPFGVVSAWRWVDPDGPMRQVVFVEVAATWRDTPAWKRLERRPLLRGVASFAVPESVTVDYDHQTVYHLEPGQPATDGPVTRWHPLRTDVPVLSLYPYSILRSVEEERAQLNEEAAARLLALPPGLGTLVSLYDTLKWAFGDDSVPVVASAGADLPEPDHNAVDTVAQGWDVSSTAVAFSVPVRLTAPDQAADLRAHANWQLPREPGGKAMSSKVSFQTVSRVEVPGDTESEPAVENWPMYQYDARNTGRAANASGPSPPVEVAWTYAADGRLTAGPVVGGGTLYVGDGAGTVHAVDRGTGERRWTYGTDDSIRGAAAVAGGRVFVGSSDHRVYALDAATGDLAWKRDLGWKAFTPITVRDGRVYSGRGNGNVYAIEAASGEVAWTFRTEGAISVNDNVETAPAVASGTVVFGSSNSYVVAVSAADGSEVWRFDTGPEGFREGGAEGSRVKCDPTVAGDTVYAGSNDGFLYALGLGSGDTEWRREVGTRMVGSPAVADGTVYVGADDGVLRALDAATGDLDWHYQTGDSITGGPVVAGDTLYVGSHDRSLYALDAATGDRRWRLELDGPLGAAPAVLDGTVYVTGREGVVYAVSGTA